MPGKVIYELVEGTGKQRGDRSGGRQDLSSWSTIVLSSGESRLLDFAKASDAGTAHRVISLHGSPWGSHSRGEDVRRLREGLASHYGHAGRLFVRWLAANCTRDVKVWKARRRALRCSFDALTLSNVAAERLSDDLALILVAAELAHEALDLPWPVDQAHAMMHQILSEITESTKQCASHEAALRGLWDWCWSQRDSFWGQRRMETPPSQGWAGRWDLQKEDWQEIFIVPSIADRILKDLGFQPLSVRKDWADADFIRRGEGRNLLAAVRIDGTRLRCLALKRQAIMNICSIGEELKASEESEKKDT